MYLGRVVGIGLTEDGIPYGVYAVSARSTKDRKALILDEGKRIFIDAKDEETRDELVKTAKPENIFYNAMFLDNERRFAVITNGKQSDMTYAHLINNDSKDSLTAISFGFEKAGGPEPDDYNTPRISGVLDVEKPRNNNLGKISIHGESLYYAFIEKGKLSYISTYNGDPSDPRKVVISPEFSKKMDFSGKIAQELADNMYDWMDSDLVVCSAATLWDPDKKMWELAVRNLHG